MHANHYTAHDREDTVVPLTGADDTRDDWIQSHLDKLFEHFTQTNAEFGGRLDRIHSRTQELEAKAGQLQSQANSIASSVEVVKEDTSALKRSVNTLETQALATGSKLGSIDSELRGITEAASALGDRTQVLEMRFDELHEADGKLASEHMVLEGRVSGLEPRHQVLEDTSRTLLRDTEALKGETDKLGNRFQWASWAAGAVALFLIGAVGYTYWAGASSVELVGSSVTDKISEVTGKIQRIESSQLHAAALEQRVDTLQRQVDMKIVGSTEMQTEFENLSGEVQVLDDRLTTATEGMRGELTAIKERIYASDENPQGAGLDLAALRDSSWLADQAPGHFAIQLVNVYRKTDLADFIVRHQRHLTVGELSYFKTVHRGRDMFVLLYGNYASFRSAMDQLEALPEALQTNRPYLRTIESVHRSSL